MDAETRDTLIAAFKQGRATPDYQGGSNDRNGDYDNDYIEGPNGSKLWFIGYGDDEGDGKAMFRFHHVQLANGDNYDTPPAGSGETTRENDESNRGRAYDAGASARKKAARQAAKKAEKSAAQSAAYAEDMQVIQQALDINEPEMPNKIPTKPKRVSRLAEKAQGYIDDYQQDLEDIKLARGIQREDGKDVLAKGKKLKDINAKRADKLADEARTIISDHEKSQPEPKEDESGDNTSTDSTGNSSDTATNDAGAGNEGNKGNQTKNKDRDERRGSGTGGNTKTNDDSEGGENVAKKPKKDANSKKPNGNKPAGSSFAPDPNGDNLVARFAKVYGDKAPGELRKAIDAYNAANTGQSQIVETYQMGQYGYSVKIVDNNNQVIATETDDIKNKLKKYIAASDAMNQQHADDKNPTRSALVNTKLELSNTEAGGNMPGMTRRVAYAYTGGDEAKASELITQAALKNPKKIKIINPGQTGSYIQVISENGDWTNNADAVAKVLASNVRVDGAKPVAYNQQARQQQAYISGANGMAVMNRLNLAMNTTGTDRLKTALDQLENAKKGDQVKVHGTLGQPGFWISVKKDGKWVNGTNAVLDKLKPYAGTRAETPPPPPPAAPPATSSDGTTDGSSDNTQSPDPSDSTAPGTDSTTTADPSTGTNDGTDGTDTTDGTDSAPDTTADSTDTSTEGDGSGTADSSTDTTDTTQVDTKPKGAVADDSRMPGVNGAGAAANMSVNEVDISAAAQKSEALIAADLNKDGTVTAKEDTVLNAADRNQDGTVGAQELEKFVATADVNQDGALTRTESKAFKTIDSNDDNKISERELRAFRSVAGEDGEISRAEAKEALKAQIDNKQDQLEHDLAVEYLRRTNEQEGGSQAVGEQAAALVSAQQPKPNKPDNDGPGKKNKKNK